VPENEDPRAERRMLLAIANQPIATNPTATVGADVSRFQRSTVPGRADRADPRAEDRQAMRDVIGAIASRQAPPATVTAPAAPERPVGPVVRIARGNNVTLVPVGAN